MNYYNEWDAFAAEWLKQLIKDGLIPPGVVDSRSIEDVEPEDLKGFTQCHFFAGIGGWSRALQIAGWSPDRPVWTGSPPCQSFSTAGKGKGKEDERHLWPVFFNLIRECQPPTVFGEQVAAAIRFGWLDDLQIDFEKEGYAAGAFVLPSGSIGAPHKRDRLFFVADANNKRHEWSERVRWEAQRGAEHTGSVSMAYSCVNGQQRSREMGRSGDTEESGVKEVNRAINVSGVGSSIPSRNEQPMAYPGSSGFQGDVWVRETREEELPERYSSERSSHSSMVNPNSNRSTSRDKAAETARHRDSIDSASFWSDSREIYCRDGKYRSIPTEPALFPLVNGISNRVGILRGAGNAIVPQAAAEIVKAYLYD